MNDQTTRDFSPPDLVRLAEQVAMERATMQLHPQAWTALRTGPDGTPLRDVAIVGAGMCGIAAAAALQMRGLCHIAMFDQSPDGIEGPWVSTARMETLRSPKHLPGIPASLPSLSFRAWYIAQHGTAGWEALYKIPNQDWMDYLTWVRRTLDLPLQSGVRVQRISLGDDCVRLHLTDADGPRILHARRVVLATGRGGAGGLFVPDFVDPSLRPDRAAHTGEAIEFARLAGRRVAVIGAGPSAWDNAATALERGATSVDMFCRRTMLPQINKGRGNASPAWFENWGELEPDQKWALMVYLHDLQAPPPHETVLRTIRHAGFRLHFATPVASATRGDDGVVLTLAGGAKVTTDFLILGTGFRIDLSQVPELADVCPQIALWSDRYAPPAALARPALGCFPFLGPGFELLERAPGMCPALNRVHLFNHGAAASLGPIASDIPGASLGADRLARAISRHFFREDFPHIRAALEAFDEPELIETPFYVPTDARKGVDGERK